MMGRKLFGTSTVNGPNNCNHYSKMGSRLGLAKFYWQLICLKGHYQHSHLMVLPSGWKAHYPTSLDSRERRLAIFKESGLASYVHGKVHYPNMSKRLPGFQENICTALMFEAFSLESGFTSLRKCHLCTSQETHTAHVRTQVYVKSLPRPIISINIQ